MLSYKNVGLATKTFYGVTFKAGETKSVPGYINDPKFIRVKSVPQEPPKVAADKPAVKNTADKPAAKTTAADKTTSTQEG